MNGSGGAGFPEKRLLLPSLPHVDEFCVEHTLQKKQSQVHKNTR
jgi:hypothetical protein